MYNKIITAALLSLAFAGARAQVTLYSESFETNGEGVRYFTNTYNEPTPNCNFFYRAAASPLDPCFQNNFFTNFQGSFFWGSEDIMRTGAPLPPGSIETQPVNITNYGSLSVSLFLATANNNGTRWETADSINIQASFNGGVTYATVGRFMGTGVTGGDLVRDANLNGVVDGAEASSIASINTFTKYSFAIPGSGTSLRIRIDFDQTGGSEELGVDLIEVTGTLVLPVKLLHFNAAVTNGHAGLQWKIDDNANAAFFEIEKSTGGGFTAAHRITATSERTYSFTDNNVSGTAYYRLKITDKNGQITYSRIVSVSADETVFALEHVFPNPAADDVNLVLRAAKNFRGFIILLNNDGKTVLRQPVTLFRGQTVMPFSLMPAGRGLYLLKIFDETGAPRAEKKIQKL